jgi:Flp pilus assembly protein TadG
MTLRIDTRGTTAVEFCIAISAVLAVTFGIIDLGRMGAAKHALDYGVATAVRYAVVNSASATTTTIAAKVTTALTPIVGATQASAATVNVSFSPSEAVGGTVTVSASLSWTPDWSTDFLPNVTLASSQTLTIVH